VPPIEKVGGGSVRTIRGVAGENRNVRTASHGSSKTAVDHRAPGMVDDLGLRGIPLNPIAHAARFVGSSPASWIRGRMPSVRGGGGRELD
jgi:hypothetical protein